MSRIVVKLAVVAVVAAGLVLGASAPGWSYVGLKGGMYMPNSDDKGLDGWDTGFGGELAVGGEFGQGPVGFGLEGGLGGFIVKPEHGDVNLTIVPITLTGKLLVRPAEILTLFVGGGFGYYVGMLGGDDVSEMSSSDKTGQGLGFQAVGGVEVLLGAVGLIAELKWSMAEVKFGDSDDKINIGGTAILVGLTF